MRVLLLCVLLLSSRAEAAPVTPTGKWVVNFDHAQCVASRPYGDEQIFLKASPFGDLVQVGVAEPGRSGAPAQVDAEVRPATGAAFKGTALRWTTGGKAPTRLRLINMPQSEFERLAASPVLRVSIDGFHRDYSIGGMDTLSRVMKDCVTDLQRVWTSEGGVAAAARANLASFFSSNDYPDSAVREERSGTVRFALLIDERGRVADCMVTQTSGQAMLDTQTCATLKRRAVFTPARNSAGQPTKDRMIGSIRWVLP